jgi:pseudo-rSAM protein
MKHVDLENSRGRADYWLFLHPYVYVSVKKDRAILYNTWSHHLLEYDCESPIYPLVKRLNADSNLYVIKIKTGEIDGRINGFIDQLRNLYFGDVVNTAICTRKPIQLKPILSLQRYMDPHPVGDEKNRILERDDIPDYLNIITLYINSDCPQSCSICGGAYKQFLCCHRRDGKKRELTKDNIAVLIEQIKNSNLHKINIAGGNLFSYSRLEDLAGYLNGCGALKVYCLHYLNIEDRPDFFGVLKGGNNQITIMVHAPVDDDVFNNKVEILKKSRMANKFNIRFVVQNDSDIGLTESLISKFNFEEFQVLPYFNGDNIDFFQRHVFTDKESILKSRPDMHDILVRTVLNTTEFKKLNVLSDRSIHANLNNPKIGQLGKDHIYEIMYRELHQGKSWKRTRNHVQPCKSCVFNSLCPPISNYEYVFGTYDLCYMSPSAGAR